MDSADADYCFDWMGREDLRSSRLLLVKINHGLKPIPLTQGPLECMVSYESHSSAEFHFIDEAGKKEFVFESWLAYKSVIAGGSGSSISIDGLEDGIKIREIPIAVEVLQGEIEVDFPNNVDSFITQLKSDKGYKKEYLLQFKDKIVDAYIKHEIFCPPNLDTIYHVNFRARITGECNSDVLSAVRSEK
jgi:hypothetical protein